MAWTLQAAGDEEKSFEALGVALGGSILERKNMAPDVLRLIVPGPMDGALLWDYGTTVVVRRDRSLVDGAYTGGTTYFCGTATAAARSGRGNEEFIEYQFSGPWWNFERLVFQQPWRSFVGFVAGVPAYATMDSSEVFLGMTINGTPQHTGAQILEAVNWAYTCGLSIAVGTIDPATNIPMYNARDLTVAEVIIQMARWTPDVVCWFDYTASPLPAFYCRRLANLTEATVSASGGTIEALGLTPRSDLILPAVCLRFKQVGSFDGQPRVQIVNQVAPVGATGRELGASVHTIELQGNQQTNVTGELECVAVAAQSEIEEERIAWWMIRDPLLGMAKIDPESLSVASASIEDEEGEEIDLEAYPNELRSGQVAAWMTLPGNVPVGVVDAVITAEVTYDIYVDDARTVLLQAGRKKTISVRMKLTNGISASYWAVNSFTAGEAIPTGLAADIYAARSVLQYEGTISLVGLEVTSAVGMGNKLTINTGGASYSDLLVQSVVQELGSGRTQVGVGPATHLGLADLVELLRVNRNRLTYNNPLTRTEARVTTGVGVTLGKNTPRENTTTGDVWQPTVSRFLIVESLGTHVSANPWDPEIGESGGWDLETEILVAKPQHFRTDHLSEVFLDGAGEEETVTYVYATDNQRTATLGEESELQVPIPRYLPDMEIQAVQAEHTGVFVDEVELVWLEVAPSRVWAKQAGS